MKSCFCCQMAMEQIKHIPPDLLMTGTFFMCILMIVISQFHLPGYFASRSPLFVEYRRSLFVRLQSARLIKRICRIVLIYPHILPGAIFAAFLTRRIHLLTSPTGKAGPGALLRYCKI